MHREFCHAGRAIWKGLDGRPSDDAKDSRATPSQGPKNILILRGICHDKFTL